METVAARLDQVTSEVQDAIMQTRMQPIGTVLTKFNRIVRDLSSKLGKQCTLTIEGKDVEVDKTIIEAIGDPSRTWSATPWITALNFPTCVPPRESRPLEHFNCERTTSREK